MIEYLKACRLWLTSIFFLLFLLSYTANICSNFWLSFWSNESESQPNEAIKKKYFYLAIYALLGFLECKMNNSNIGNEFLILISLLCVHKVLLHFLKISALLECL